MKELILLVSTSLLVACSPMKPKDCANANWKDIGFNDAAQGRSVWLNSRSKVCARVNIKPNAKAYLEGHRLGSRLYCTIENGVEYGRTGHDLPIGVCTEPALAKQFQRGYAIGYEIFQDLEDLRERRFWLHGFRHGYGHHHHGHGGYNHKHKEKSK